MSGAGSRPGKQDRPRKSAILALSLFFILFLTAWTRENIRVSVADDLATVTIKSVDGLRIGGLSGKTARRIAVKPADIGAAPLRIASEGSFIQVNGKSYRGSVELRKNQKGLIQVINDLDIEDYLKGVVASEIPHDWEPEALKAQAVTSRTYALYRKKTAGKRPYHIVATVRGQVYDGKNGERETTTTAVRATERIVLMHGGDIIPAFYHSSCGGHTENASELWEIDEPYLQGVECECQNISKYGSWEKRMSIVQIADALGKQGYRVTGIKSARIDGITRAGRVKNVAIKHSGGAASIPAEKFRAAVGYSSLPSAFFEMEVTGHDIVVSGRGLGHGVGLCQWGAKEMAQRGYDYKSILRHYYPGTSLGKW